ncbi:MAG TPA: hypothetical protein VJR06_07920, partial [Nitrososphaerales archaeon]|nr:hypothetical protein [Nitrososphaerales archaeon]
MVLKAFTKNYADNSTESGFQFTFFCDVCQDGYKSQFVPSKTYKKGGLFRGLGQVASMGASITGHYGTGYAVGTGSNVLSERFQGMTPEWHKEHDEAFDRMQNEATGHFHRCPRCHQWVCENDWNEQGGLCVN